MKKLLSSYLKLPSILKSLKSIFVELSTFAVMAYLVQRLCNHFIHKWQAEEDLRLLKLAESAIVIQRFYRSYRRIKMLRRTMQLARPRVLLNKRIASLKAQSAIDAWVLFTVQHKPSPAEHSSFISDLCGLWDLEDENFCLHCSDLLEVEILIILGSSEIDDLSGDNPEKLLFSGRVGTIVLPESPVMINDQITSIEYPPMPAADVGYVDVQAVLSEDSKIAQRFNSVNDVELSEVQSFDKSLVPVQSPTNIVNAHTITLGHISPAGQRPLNTALATSDALSLKKIKRTTEVMVVNALEQYGKCHVIDGQLMFHPHYDIFGPNHVTFNLLTQIQEVNISEAFRLLKKYQGYFPRALCHRLELSPQLSIWIPIPGTYWRCTHDDFGVELPTALVGVEFEPCIEADDPTLAITYSNALLLPHL